MPLTVKFKIAFIQIFLAVIFSYFYLQLVPAFPLQEFDEKFREAEGQISFVLPAKTTYLLKVWGLEKPTAVYFNNELLTHFFFKQRGDNMEFHFALLKDKIRKGKNVLNIISNIDYSVRVKNTVNYNDFSAILLKPLSSQYKRFFLSRVLPVFFGFLCFQLLSWFVCFFTARKFLGLSFENYILGYVLTFSPAFLLFLIAIGASLWLPFSIVVFKLAFIKIFIGLVLLFQIPWFLWVFIGKNIIGRDINIGLSKEDLDLRINKFRRKLEEYGLVQWYMGQKFCDKCILGFFVFLFLSAFLLAFQIKFLAEFFAIMGFFALFCAVIIKFRQA